MSSFSWNTEDQDLVTDRHEYEATTKDFASFNSPVMSGRLNPVVVEGKSDGDPVDEITATQKMLSAVSGSLLTSLLGM